MMFIAAGAEYVSIQVCMLNINMIQDMIFF